MSATAKIIGGVALVVAGVILIETPVGGFLISSGIGLAPGGTARRLPARRAPEVRRP